MGDAGLTGRQKKGSDTVAARFETRTGRPLAVWVDILTKGCPETRPQAQAAWLKASYGIDAPEAALILNAARPADQMSWDDAEALRAALWAEPRSLAVLQALERKIAGIEGVMTGQRKGYTRFSRTEPFAAIRPLKGGKALLGLKLDPALSPRLAEATGRDGWSDRLTAVIELDGPGAVTDDIGRLFAQAADKG